LHHARRPLEQKESQKWLNGARRASEVLAKALCITVVSDRESDLYEDFALKPENVQVLIRASANRNLVNGEKLFGYASRLPEAGRISVTIPARSWQANPRGASGAALRPRDDQETGTRHAKP